MAETKKYYHNIDLIKNKVTNLLLNPLTSTERNALTSSLTTSDEGYTTYDTTLNQQFFWDGTTWITSGGDGGGGAVNAVTAAVPITYLIKTITYFDFVYYSMKEAKYQKNYV